MILKREKNSTDVRYAVVGLQANDPVGADRLAALADEKPVHVRA